MPLPASAAIGIIDGDRVSLDNLQRQVVHDTPSVGVYKTRSAAKSIERLNPQVETRLYSTRLQPENAIEILSNYDIVADGSDNFATRYLVNDACYFAKRPLVFAAVGPFDGHLTTFRGHERDEAGNPKPNYRCLFPEAPPPGTVAPCSEAGILGAVAGVMGTLQAVEVLKELLGIGESLVGRLLLYDALQARFSTLTYAWDPDNPLKRPRAQLPRPVASPRGHGGSEWVTQTIVGRMPTETVTTGCCIAGGGPAGMMLGYLLARAGVEVMVLEKHADFLRDFRGDTIHPSTLEIMHELGLLDEFLKRPHQELRELAGQIGEDRVVLADFSHLPTRCKFIAFMPQWDFLDFLAERRRPIQASACACRPRSPISCRTATPSSACGRRCLRGRSKCTPISWSAPTAAIRRCATSPASRSRISARPWTCCGCASPSALRTAPSSSAASRQGTLFVMLDRGDYWQCAFIIPKGGFAELRRRGLPAFRAEIVKLNPALANRVQEIKSWDDVKLLTVRVDRLKRWYRPGVLCIGDAAHAMSPVGGVGINLAIQDAVAAANILAVPLQKGPVPVELLAKVQRRREWPTRDDAGGADLRSEPRHQQCSRHADPAARALRGEAAQPIPVAPPPAGTAHRHGLPPRARAKP